MGYVDQLIALVEEWTGIRLERSGVAEALPRLVRERVEALGLRSEEEYVERLRGPLGDERASLIDAVTVKFTWFHRDSEQMQGIASLLREGWPPGRALQIWVPGCATGEDAYTLAMLAELAGREARVLGTDLNSASVAYAREGRYGPWSMREIPGELWRFLVAQRGGFHAVQDELKRRVAFAEHNLLHPPPLPARGGWDLILCRNVLIYFSPARSEDTRARLGAALSPGGWLLLGGSEPLRSEPPGLQLAWWGGRAALRRSSCAEGLERPAALAPQAPPGAEPGPGSIHAPRPQELALSLVAEGERHIHAAPLQAIHLFRRAREADPLCVEAHLHLGIGLHLLGDARAAVPVLRAALFLDPVLWPAAFYLALSYEALGRREEARREYERVLETSDRSPRLAVRGAVHGIEQWKPDVLALSRRRARHSIIARDRVA